LSPLPDDLKYSFPGIAVLDLIRDDFNKPVMVLRGKIFKGYFSRSFLSVHILERGPELLRVMSHAVHIGRPPGLKSLVAEHIPGIIIGFRDGKANRFIFPEITQLAASFRQHVKDQPVVPIHDRGNPRDTVPAGAQMQDLISGKEFIEIPFKGDCRRVVFYFNTRFFKNRLNAFRYRLLRDFRHGILPDKDNVAAIGTVIDKRLVAQRWGDLKEECAVQVIITGY